MKVRDLKDLIDRIPDDYEVKTAFMDSGGYDYIVLSLDGHNQDGELSFNVVVDDMTRTLIFEGDYTK